MAMALPAQKQHSRRLLASWREDNIKIKRHSSAPPPKIHSTTTSAPSSSTATAASPPSAETYDQLSFPMPTFSKALKVIGNESYTLRSQATGRRWRAVSSSRECQFGEVLRAVEVIDEEVAASSPAYFAIKELNLDKLREVQGRTYEDPLREVAALQFLSSHPNVLPCTEALWDSDSIYIVTPFYSGGEVFDALTDRGRYEEGEARPLLRQVLHALRHLKIHGVCHRDVSLENLLLDEGNTVKLVDFGLALRIPQNPDGGARVLLPQGPCGKPFYIAPEVLSSSVSSGFDGFAVDVWACGVLLFVMLTGVPPFEMALPSQDQRCQIVAVEERLVDLLSAWGISLSPEAAGLIQSCLRHSPAERPSVENLLRHPWMKAS
ncbi:unnamed protein product [Ectocarpus sp. 4 AP-2014]